MVDAIVVGEPSCKIAVNISKIVKLFDMSYRFTSNCIYEGV